MKNINIYYKNPETLLRLNSVRVPIYFETFY